MYKEVSINHAKLIDIELKNKKPHKCPVCGGLGKRNKYINAESTQVVFFVCASCDGKGIVWG